MADKKHSIEDQVTKSSAVITWGENREECTNMDLDSDFPLQKGNLEQSCIASPSVFPYLY